MSFSIAYIAFNPDNPLALNPSRPPLDRGGAELALPLFEAGSQQSCGVPASIPLAGARGSWRGFGSNELSGFNSHVIDM